ncbi:MAG: aminoglycoside phosphotransferase [Betaproteobacteria bacterium]|nr:MAG: aminoglycoside phosphotransferase [Betaproteobacteria bacterium]
MERTLALQAWLGRLFPAEKWQLEPASADASFRRYFRISLADRGESRIVMDAPPQQEDCRPFIRVAALLRQAGLNAPAVLAQDLGQGFLLLTDLGATTYLAALQRDAARADALFRDATDALIAWQLASRPGVLPPYDAALLRRELDLFPHWYLARHLGLALSPAQRQVLERMFALIMASNLAEPAVYVHRDYMPRNLMVSEPNPGILDFQDAVYGPISYDVASLVRDAFISWEEERALDWVVRYWDRARRAGLPLGVDFGDFYRDLEWMGLQRHLKVLGIFARIYYRDGKPGYVEDTPRFVRYARAVAGRYNALAPLAHLFDEIEKQQTAQGKIFP